jgi:hypothetical protein
MQLHIGSDRGPARALSTAILAAVLIALPALAQAASPPAPAIHWVTDVVDLTADSLAIEANGLTFTTQGVPVAYGSDPGGPDYWTLEVEWTEHAVPQRLYLYFGSDGEEWWVDEIRTRDGYPQDEWIYYRGPFFRTPVGQVYTGDVRLEGIGTGRPDSDIKVPGVLSIQGLRLAVTPRSADQVYAAPPGGGIVATSDPFEPGGPLHCSGILALDPAVAHQRIIDAGDRVSYRKDDPTQGSVLLTVPPTGIIESTALGGYGEVVIFVIDAAAGAKPLATTPPECPNVPGSPATSATAAP